MPFSSAEGLSTWDFAQGIAYGIRATASDSFELGGDKNIPSSVRSRRRGDHHRKPGMFHQGSSVC